MLYNYIRIIYFSINLNKCNSSHIYFHISMFKFIGGHISLLFIFLHIFFFSDNSTLGIILVDTKYFTYAYTLHILHISSINSL